MDALTAMILVRGILSGLLVAGGFSALFIGWKLYYHGIGLSPDRSTVKASTGTFDIRLSLKNVGATVMVTSVAWGLVAIWSLPSYRRLAEGIEEVVADSNKARRDLEDVGRAAAALKNEMVQALAVAEGLRSDWADTAATAEGAREGWLAFAEMEREMDEMGEAMEEMGEGMESMGEAMEEMGEEMAEEGEGM